MFRLRTGRYDSLGSLNGRVRSAELVAITGAPVAAAPLPTGAGRVVLYEYPNFRGQSFAINGSELPKLNRMGFSDRAASVRIEEGYWLFCTDTQFQGDCRTLGPGEYARLPRDVDRRIASMRRVNDVYGALSSGGRYFR